MKTFKRLMAVSSLVVAVLSLSACVSPVATYRPNLEVNDRASVETLGVVQDYYDVSNEMAIYYCFQRSVANKSDSISKNMVKCIPFRYDYVRARRELIVQLLAYNKALYVLSLAKDAEKFKADAAQLGNDIEQGAKYLSQFASALPEVSAGLAFASGSAKSISEFVGEIGKYIKESKTEAELSERLRAVGYFKTYQDLVDVLISDMRKSRETILRASIGEAYIRANGLEESIKKAPDSSEELDKAIKTEDLLQARGKSAAEALIKFEKIMATQPELALVGMKQANEALKVYAESDRTEADKKALENAMNIFSANAVYARKTLEIARGKAQ